MSLITVIENAHEPALALAYTHGSKKAKHLIGKQPHEQKLNLDSTDTSHPGYFASLVPYSHPAILPTIDLGTYLCTFTFPLFVSLHHQAYIIENEHAHLSQDERRAVHQEKLEEGLHDIHHIYCAFPSPDLKRDFLAFAQKHSEPTERFFNTQSDKGDARPLAALLVENFRGVEATPAQSIPLN